jgi:hypothetical protein
MIENGGTGGKKSVQQNGVERQTCAKPVAGVAETVSLIGLLWNRGEKSVAHTIFRLFGYSSFKDSDSTDILSLAPRPTLKKRHIENDLLLVCQKRRLRLDTKSKRQYDSEGSPSKTVILKMT